MRKEKGGRKLTKKEKEKNLQLNTMMTTPSNQSTNLNLGNFQKNVRNPDLKNALAIGGATALGVSGIKSLITGNTQRKGKKNVYDQFIQDKGGQLFIDRCTTGNCPGVKYYNPDQNWFYNAANSVQNQFDTQGYSVGSASAGTSNDSDAYDAVQQGYKDGTINTKKNMSKQYGQNIKSGIRSGITTGVGSYLLNKALDNTKFGRKLQNKLGMDINLGIFKQDGGQRAKQGGVKKYATAGMYNNNIPQALSNSTTNIVGAERNSSVLAQNQAGIQSVADNLKRKNEQLGSELSEIESQKKSETDAAAANVGKGSDAILSTVGKGLKSEKGQGLIKGLFGKAPPPQIGGSLSTGIDAGSALTTPMASTPTSQLLGATPGITPSAALNAPLNVPSIGASGGIGGAAPAGNFGGASLGADKLAANLGTGALTNAASGASKFAGLGTTGMTFGKAGATGLSGAAAGAGKFLTSGAGLGTVATLAGKGISKLSDDGKAYQSNTGEYAGSILSAAGTGASFGSIVPGVGTAIGAAAGAIYGAGKQYLGTKKAKQKKAEMDSAQAEKQEEYNANLEDSMGAQLTQARVGEMEQKTYSGYDMGRNITARFGGRRMQMPRYQ